jgi:UDP-GlcNAc:undecaprenyl-phosphate GlcNAc-1-phosphate transferase
VITASVAFVVSLAVAVVGTPLIRSIAVRRGLLDQARSSRKIHDRPIPRLGGIAIVVAFYAPFVALLGVESGVGYMFYERPNTAIGFFAGGLAIALLGVYDDLKGTDATRKFAVQFAVAGLLYYLGFRVEQIANPFGPDIELGIFAIPFTMLWIVGVINAMNLIDGLDGLAGVVALFAVLTTFIVAVNQPNALMMLFTAALAGAILGFLFYNFNPATIFMGDTGSMFLGFILAAASIKTGQKSSTAVAILTPIVALGLPILDTLLAMARRAVRGRPLFSADKEHIHHRLMSLGMSHRQAAFALYAVCLALNVVALVLVFSNSIAAASLLAALTIVGFLAMRRLGYIQFSSTHFLSDQRRRNRELRTIVRDGSDRLREAATDREVWDVIKQLAPDVGAVAVSLSRQNAPDSEAWTTLRFEVADVPPTHEHPAFASSLHVPTSRSPETLVEFTWRDGRSAMDRDEEIALESFAERVAEAFDRVAPGARRSFVSDAASSLMNIGYASGILPGRRRRTGDLVAEDGKETPEAEGVTGASNPEDSAG